MRIWSASAVRVSGDTRSAAPDFRVATQASSDLVSVPLVFRVVVSAASFWS